MWKKIVLTGIFMICFLSSIFLHSYVESQSTMNKKTVSCDVFIPSVENKVSEKVYASGIPVGIYIKTKGVLILGTQEIIDDSGMSYNPSENKLRSGDYLLKFNEEKITSKKQLLSLISDNKEKEVQLTILRDKEKLHYRIKPVYSRKSDSYQLGIWIRNDTQGIGTISYVKEDGSFLALGHGIKDFDLGTELSISEGELYSTDISSILKGKKGQPGELVGSIDYSKENYLGTIKTNSGNGVTGTIKNHLDEFKIGIPMEIAPISQIKKGNAFIRTSISGTSKNYTIKIEKVKKIYTTNKKTITFQVTDKRLLSLTGGIVQGLSGAPIIQDGKLIGVVTHVLVNDPTRGYAIFAQSN